MKSCLRTFLVILCASTLAFAGDHEFRGVVSAIESHYGVRHTHIPLLGFAMFFARPEGISGFKLAVFEDFHPSAANAADDVRDVVDRELGPDWHLFVRTHSRADHENTLIYANLSSGKFQMLIVNLEPGEATVIEMKLSERAMRKWIQEPKGSADDESSHHHHQAED